MDDANGKWLFRTRLSRDCQYVIVGFSKNSVPNSQWKNMINFPPFHFYVKTVLDIFWVARIWFQKISVRKIAKKSQKQKIGASKVSKMALFERNIYQNWFYKKIWKPDFSMSTLNKYDFGNALVFFKNCGPLLRKSI